MAKDSPKKPTTPFGSIDFGKDGKVRPNIKSLSRKKELQEAAVVQQLAAQLGSVGILCDADIKELEEANHDALLSRSNGRDILVQLTEVVWRDYAVQLNEANYLEGKFTGTVIYEGKGAYLEVDKQKLKQTLIEKLHRKLAKNYSPSSNEDLWLVVWSVSPFFSPFVNEGGEAKTWPCVPAVRKFVEQNGSGPFDQGWFINLNAPRPHRIF